MSYELWLIIFSLVHRGLLIQNIVAYQAAKYFGIWKKVPCPKLFPVLFLSIEKMLIEFPSCYINDSNIIKIYLSTRSGPSMRLMLFSDIVSMALSTLVWLSLNTASILPFQGICSDLIPFALNTIIQISS